MLRGIVARYIREGRIRGRPRGGRNNVLVNDEMRQHLVDIINDTCVVTLSQINGELRRRLPAKPLIHDRAAAQSLEGIPFRFKLVRPVPADVMFWKEGKNMETGSRTMTLCTTVFLSMSAVTTYIHTYILYLNSSLSRALPPSILTTNYMNVS